MNLGQMMMVTGAIVLLGILVLNANTTVYQANDTMYTSEFGVTGISLATSLVEEAMGKMFDAVVSDSTSPSLMDSTKLTLPALLGPEAAETESYRGMVSGLPHDFDDFDDFNGLKICYFSDAPGDSTNTAGYLPIMVPGMRAKYYLTCTVTYVKPPNLDADYAVRQTWHKKITVTVWSPSSLKVNGSGVSVPDTLVYPAIMSYWN
jgi:hypothetical protein